MSSYTISRYRMDGTVSGTEELSADCFGRLSKGNTSALLHQVAVAMMANIRQPLAHTKRRGEVQGGGKKPWKQKGTGRARVGSIRSPLWKGGGVVFGPRSNRNYTQKINDKMKHKAFLAALKEHLDANALAILEVEAQAPKTKIMTTTLNTIRSGWSSPRQAVLMLCSQSSDALVRRMTRNIADTTVEDIATLSVMDVLRYPYLLLTPAAFELLKKRIQK